MSVQTSDPHNGGSINEPRAEISEGLGHQSFEDVKKKRWRSSILVFAAVTVIYMITVPLLVLSIAVPVLLITHGGVNIWDILFFSWGLAIIIALIHFWEARLYGSKEILKMVRAMPPDPSDRYHQQFANTAQEMAIAAGVPKLDALVLPSHAVNSMAIIAADGTPIILASEGMLAECDRDEVQAALAHELAHILSGDTFYVTLVCSLATFFDRIRDALEPPEREPGFRPRHQNDEGLGALFIFAYMVAMIGGLLLRLLGTLISRQREFMADASAVDFTRNPLALGRVIYKAQLSHSFLGDFHMSYSPLYIVAPESSGESGSFLSGFVSTHPPVDKRIEAVASMGFTEPNAILRDVWERRKAREENQQELAQAPEAAPPPQVAEDEDKPDDTSQKIWRVRNSKGDWEGPFTPDEIVSLNFFTPRLLVENTVDNFHAPGAEFMEIQAALCMARQSMGDQMATRRAINDGEGNRVKLTAPSTSGAGSNSCPHCRTALKSVAYEGVTVLACPHCHGKGVKSRDDAKKVIIRKDVGFSKELVAKALEASNGLMVNPHKLGGDHAQQHQRLSCPYCRALMMPRPYNYQYFLPIDECLSCGGLWFDADELEILQIWIERGVSLGTLGRAHHPNS